MVSIPVLLYKAVESGAPQFQVAGSSANSPERASATRPVEERASAAAQGSELSRARSIARDELESDFHAVLKAADEASLKAPTSTEIEIGTYVRMVGIDPMYLHTAYNVLPGPGSGKLYSMFRETLADMGLAACGDLAMRGRDRRVLIFPRGAGLALHTLYYSNELRSEEEFHSAESAFQDVDAVSQMLMETLIAERTKPFNPSILGKRRLERQLNIAEDRSQAAAGGSTPEPRGPAQVVDIGQPWRNRGTTGQPPQAGTAGPAPGRKGTRRKK